MLSRSRSLVLAFCVAVPAIVAAPASAQARIPHLYYPTADSKLELSRAMEKAKADKRLVMVVFGSDWCVDCWVLDTLLHHPTIAPIVHQNFEVVKVDIGRWDLNLDITKKYGDPIEKGVPAVIILNANGAMLATTRDKPWENAIALKPEDVRDQLKAWAVRK